MDMKPVYALAGLAMLASSPVSALEQLASVSVEIIDRGWDVKNGYVAGVAYSGASKKGFDRVTVELRREGILSGKEFSVGSLTKELSGTTSFQKYLTSGSRIAVRLCATIIAYEIGEPEATAVDLDCKVVGNVLP